jgi:hypothetical protein
MAITSAAKTAISQILATWETGSPTAGYKVISILADGAGFSGGVHQATDKGGNLDRILQTYIDMHGKFASEFAPFQDELAANLSAGVDPKNPPAWAVDFMKLWRKAAGEDAWFCRAQDQVFDAAYWAPCAQQCEAMKLALPVSWGVCYDICIQSGPGGLPPMRRLFAEAPPSGGGDEKVWVRALVGARRKWLAEFVSGAKDPVKKASHEKLVRNTVYRMDGWLDIIGKGNWMLTTPFSVPLKGGRVEIPG